MKKRFFLTLLSFSILLGTALAQSGAVANGEAAVEPPVDWVLTPTLVVDNTAPTMSGTKWYKSMHHYATSASPRYVFYSPVFSEIPVNYKDWVRVNMDWKINKQLGSGTYTIRLFVKNLTTAQEYELPPQSGNLPASGTVLSGSYNNDNMAVNQATPWTQGNIKFQVRIEFYSSNTSNSSYNWFKVDNIVISNLGVNLASGGSGPADMHLQNVTTYQDDFAGRVYANATIYKAAAPPCSDPGSSACFSNHPVTIYANKFSLADDEFLGTSIERTVNIPATTSASYTNVAGLLVNDGTYYYKYYLAYGNQNYVAKNVAFGKYTYVEPIRSTPVQSYATWTVSVSSLGTNTLVYAGATANVDLKWGQPISFICQDTRVTFRDADGFIVGSIPNTDENNEAIVPVGTVRVELDRPFIFGGGF